MSENTGQSMRILVIDDSEDSRDLTEGALLSAGYADIITANSGWEALKILDIGRTTDEKPSVDVALLDIVMPEMDGVEVCARIRNDARYADLPIIMVTSLDDMNSLSNAFVAGATDYVTKPVNRVELVARVRASLKLKQELDRRQAREQELLGFLSTWGDRRAGLWIDQTTGMFVGEAAEAYLTTACGNESDEMISILAIALDRFEAYRRVNNETAVRGVLAEVSRAVRRLSATIGIVAASYRNGTIVLVAPEVGANAARELGEKLRTTISRLHLPNSESVVSDHITASVVAVTGRMQRAVDRVQLLTQAISGVKDAAGAGGDRFLALTI
jgi:sigma-B regulation protein RsbU (phosphoserine phosphatase)